MSAHVVILGCGKAKRRVASPAVDLYTGPLYRDRLALARALGGPHAILSAKHGLISPETVIEPYDVTLTDWMARGPQPTDVDDESWIDLRQRVHAQLHAMFPAFERITVLASSPYASLLPGCLAGPQAWRFDRPLAGLGMGAQRVRCRELVVEIERARAAEVDSMFARGVA